MLFSRLPPCNVHPLGPVYGSGVHSPCCLLGCSVGAVRQPSTLPPTQVHLLRLCQQHLPQLGVHAEVQIAFASLKPQPSWKHFATLGSLSKSHTLPAAHAFLCIQASALIHMYGDSALRVKTADTGSQHALFRGQALARLSTMFM